MTGKKLIAPGILSLAILAGAAYVMLADHTAAPPQAGGSQGSVPVVVAPVAQRYFETSLESLGTARANESVEITARITSPVESIEFSDGQRVTRGQVLVRLAAAEEMAEARERQVSVEEQRRELERIRGLVADRNLPRQRLDEQQSRLSEAQARLEAAQVRVADRVIRAPFDGMVGFRRVSLGALVAPGTVITTLDDISVIKLDFSVPETFLPGVASGQRIEARSAAYRDRTFQGEVTSVDTRVDPGTRAAMVRAAIPNPDGALRPGMLLTVTLVKDQMESLSIPESALMQVRDQHYVFVVTDEDRVRRQDVEAGRRVPGYVEILKGLEAGTRVVQEGTVRIRPGSAVEVVREYQRDGGRS
ncbi:efflux RND transporter periplasmic adaptor subunit [Ectothiorhodospira shaposhnikovii]|uniref:efflux RND transporter periplasmic adaptor subunit n=1 Tax=Ectothiorhodospira shaposhnikovii TaxID=1054 RepID=UPI0030841FC7